MKYNTIYLVCILSIFAKIGLAQSFVSTIPFSEEINWKNVEIKNQEDLKSTFLTQIKDFDRLVKENYCTKKELLNYLHVVDFNGDSFFDIIYEGPSGAEPNMIVIYLNSENGFKEIFNDWQGISKIEMHEGKFSGLYIDDPGCCGDPGAFMKYYSISYQGSTPKFIQIIESRYFNGCNSVLPKKSFDKPIKFRVNNDNYNLRFAPEVNDKYGHCWDEMKGNIIGVINKSEIGYALDEITDSKGKTWWFVAFPPKTNFSFLEYGEYEDESYWELGWISSSFVTKIK